MNTFPLISLDRFVCCLVLEISAVDFCLLSNIMGVNYALNVVLTASKITFENTQKLDYNASSWKS